jgi:glycosyltransferase involved in cell wall biosynthesis
VVLTCHNDGEKLSESVDSVLDQAPEPELIIVDDGSVDAETLELLRGLAARGVTVLRQPNLGQAAASMAGLRATSSPYVMRFDADDVLAPDSLAALANALDTHEEAAAAWGDVATFEGTGFVIPGIRGLDPWLVTYTNAITGSGTLFRRSAILEVGGWQLAEGWEDWDLWMALASRGFTGVYVPLIAFHYRRSDAGRLSRSLAEAEEHYAALRARHAALFGIRATSRRQSTIPLALKLAIAGTERIPGLSRLFRIQLSELWARLLWAHGIRPVLGMVLGAARVRIRRSRWR